MTNENVIYYRSPDIMHDPSSRRVEGYAVVFDSPSENMGFIETIHRGAITEETIKQSDVLARFNHDPNKILARSKYGSGSLSLTVDDIGVKYSFDAPKTALGDELLEHLHRGDITSSSFAFAISPEENSERWYKQDGQLYRDIYKIDRLYDVAPVWVPAYEATTCSARSLQMVELSKSLDEKFNAILQALEEL